MLWFWVVVLVVLIGAIAIVASGRGDSMAEVYDDRPDASLPAGRPLRADDLRTVRLNTGVRGYRMDEVDALLARLEAEMLEREHDDDVRLVTTDQDEADEDEADETAELEPGPLEETESTAPVIGQPATVEPEPEQEPQPEPILGDPADSPRQP